MTPAADMTTALVTTIAALAAVVGMILALFYAIRRFSFAPAMGRRQRQVTVLETTALGVKKSVCLVAVPGAVLVLGLTAERISLLATIDDPARVAALWPPPPSADRPSFIDQLRKAAGKK